MPRSFRRQGFLAGTAATFASIGILRTPARAAQFEYKLAHDLPVTYPLHIRSVEMCDAIASESNGRLHIQVFPNSQLGGQTAMLSQLRSGALQFLNTLNGVYGEVVPAAGLEAVGFAFKSAPAAVAALQGPLGAYVRGQFNAKGIKAFEKRWDLGMRQMCSLPKPIKSAADFAGFKMRAPPSKIAIDLFTTLGASPTPITAAEMYTSLQTHIVDGLDLPVGAVQLFKIYEVIKYVTYTNHMWSGYWLTGNLEAWNALPPDVQAIVERNAAKYALLEQQDNTSSEASNAKLLQTEGIVFAEADTASMRARLGPYYARWKATFGAHAWSLLEAAARTKLG